MSTIKIQNTKLGYTPKYIFKKTQTIDNTKDKHNNDKKS